MSEELAAGDAFGDFVVDELIGRGGMGLVYRANQVTLGRQVALKIIAPHLAEDQVFQDRFRREARQAAAIDNPAIIPIYAAGEIDGRLYLAMRYVNGTDLSSLLMAERRLTLERTFRILRQIAAGLDAAHSGGLVHRDVKPANILIEPGSFGHDRAYLTDFGLVRHTGDTHLTQTGSWLGTVNYMPPEQFQAAGKVDGRADQYSLACVAYEMLAGAPPFPRDSDPQAMFAHLNEPPPHVSEARPELPDELDVVLSRAMAKLPNDRYGSCGEFIAAFISAGDLPRSATLFDDPISLPAIAPTVIEGPTPTVIDGVSPTLPPGGDGGGAPQIRGRQAAVLGAGAAVVIAIIVVVIILATGSSPAKRKLASGTVPSTSTRGTTTSTTTGTATTSQTAALLNAGLPATASAVLGLAGTPTDGSGTYNVDGGALGSAVMTMTYDATLLRVKYAGPKLAYEWVLNQPSGLPRWLCLEPTGKTAHCYPHDTLSSPRGEAPSSLSMDINVLDGTVVSKIATKQLRNAFGPLVNGAHPPLVTMSHQAGVPVACINGTVNTTIRSLCVSRTGIPTSAHIGSKTKTWIIFTATKVGTLLGPGAFDPPVKLK